MPPERHRAAPRREREIELPFFRRLRQKGISTALDTCGAVPYEKFENVLPYTSYVLYDLKIMDPALHKEWTGADNGQILQNFRRILEDTASGKYDCDIWVRTPLIPGASATEENIRAIARFLRPYMQNGVSRWELCAFNNACTFIKLGKARCQIGGIPFFARHLFQTAGHFTKCFGPP